MATPRIVNKSNLWPGKTSRTYYLNQIGVYGDRRSVYNYTTLRCAASGQQANKGDPKDTREIDAPNSRSLTTDLGSSLSPGWAKGAKNQAYARFKKRAIGKQSQAGVAIAEWEKSFDLITRGALYMARAAALARKKKFKELARHLARRPKPRTRRRKPTRRQESAAENGARYGSNIWLYWWMGVLPTAADIFDTCEALSKDFPPGRASGSATAREKRFETISSGKWDRDMLMRHSCGAIVRVSNPNLFLLNQIGLTNPVAIAWEITPLSFMVDWVVDLQSFIESFTDFVGCSVEKPWTASTGRFSDTCQVAGNFTPGLQKAHGYRSSRSTGLPRPVPNFRLGAPSLTSSITRAATAVSILVNMFPRL